MGRRERREIGGEDGIFDAWKLANKIVSRKAEGFNLIRRLFIKLLNLYFRAILRCFKDVPIFDVSFPDERGSTVEARLFDQAHILIRTLLCLSFRYRR
jgi:hypothetical protein